MASLCRITKSYHYKLLACSYNWYVSWMESYIVIESLQSFEKTDGITLLTLFDDLVYTFKQAFSFDVTLEWRGSLQTDLVVVSQ